MNYKFKPSHIVPAYLFIVAVLYGGSKPPSSTNEPPSDISSPTNTVGRGVLDAPQPTTNENAFVCGCGVPGGHALPLRTVATPELTTNNQQLTTNMPWHVRGAYCDWVHITFPSSFAFPSGTNLLTGVTVMAYGEIRASLHQPTTNNQQLTTLPQEVSLEPSVSSFVYGLTSSNSFVFSWQNVCVNRNPTNRVDASIELFRNGDLAITVTPLSTPTPPTYTYLPAVPPEGFVGQGQDDDWLASAFPSHSAAITNLGYSAWLTDYIGHNEPNGRYKLSVTVAALPDHGPCYLVCGPYKMVVTSPGTYSFPLIDMTEYDLYTCPTAVPLTWEMDDGWDPSETDYMPLLMSPAPRLLGAPQNDNHYKIERHPSVGVTPNFLTHEEAVSRLIEVRCNAAGIAARDYRSLSGMAVVLFNQSEAIIRESLLQDEIYFYYRYNGREVCGTLYISSDYWWWWHDPDPTNGTSNVTSTNDNTSASNP